MEFKQITDLTTLPPEILFNFDELKKELETGLEKYQGLVVTEDGIKDAKSDRAKLNALYKAIDDKRKEIKKECMKPYDAFEKKTKVLLEMIGSTSGAIDSQIKAFDEMRREDKQKEIETFFVESVGELKDLLPFNRIYSAQWLNTTYSMKDIKTEITKVITKVTADLAVIDGLEGEFCVQCKDHYLRTLDLSGALAESKRLEENKKRLEEYEAKKKEEREAADLERRQNAQLAEFTKPITETHLWKAPDEPAFEQPQELAAQAEQTKTIKVIFYDTTEAFRHEMRELTEKYGIKYGGIE